MPLVATVRTTSGLEQLGNASPVDEGACNQGRKRDVCLAEFDSPGVLLAEANGLSGFCLRQPCIMPQLSQPLTEGHLLALERPHERTQDRQTLRRLGLTS